MSEADASADGMVETAPEDMSVEQLLGLLESQHQDITRRLLPELCALVDNASLALDREFEPAAAQLDRQLLTLRDELDEHIEREEEVLYEYARALAESARTGRGALPQSPPGEQLEGDHEEALSLVDMVRRMSDDCRPPGDAEASVMELYAGLDELYDELEEHIRLEEEVLLPRMADLEEELGDAQS